MMLKKQVFIFIFIVFSSIAGAQQTLTLKYFGFSIHPNGDVNAENMPTKIDRRGIAVINIGAYMGYERFFYKEKLSYKGIMALYSDCGGVFGGFFHVGFRGVILERERFSINGGLGPTLLYRRNWHSKFEDYINSGFFEGDPDDFWQYKFLWYGGELEFNYTINGSFEISLTFVPGYPKLIDFSFGIRYWL